MDGEAASDTTVAQPALAVTPTHETYAELQQAYDHFNTTLFDGKLPLCLITLQREKHSMGYFSSSRFVRRSGERTDEIAMNPGYFGIRSIEDNLSTLVHEMVHLKQAHFGKPSRGRYHNAEWAAMMQEIGLMPSHTGQPGGRIVGDHMSHYIIQGGRFAVSCAELLTRAFTLSWLDRFPPRVPSLHPPQPKAPPDLSPEAKSNPSDDEASALVVPGQPSDQAALDEAAKLLVLPSPKQENRSNRAKYRCPHCHAQVWGKPGLKIRCGEDECSQQLFEVAEA